MLSAVRYDETKKKDWDEFVRNSKMPMFMFERGYMDYHSDRFKDVSLMIYDGNKLVAIFPATDHGEEVRSHGGLTYGGFITNRHMKQSVMFECLATVCSAYRELGKSSLLYKVIPYFYHHVPAEEDRYALFKVGAQLTKVEPSTVIDLANQCKISNGRRGHIVHARKDGIVVEESHDFDTFIAMENEVLSSRHDTKAVHTAEEMKLLQSRFPNNIKLYGGFFQGRMIAGMVVYIYDTVVHSQYMAATDEARRMGALDLVVSEVIEKYKPAKKYFDFGISSEDGGKVLNEGLISQKEDFGGRTVVYEGWRLWL